MDLELMHHFTSLTYSTLPPGPGRQYFWQTTLPRFAFECDFLLHQVLVMAAFHMATVYPDRRASLVTRGLQHQEKAYQGMWKAVPGMTATNCHTIFAASSLLTIGAFADFAEDVSEDGHEPTLDNLLEIVTLIRGMHHILMRYEQILIDGPVGGLLRTDDKDRMGETSLLGKLALDLAKIEIPPDTEDAVRKVCAGVIDSFITFIRDFSIKADFPELRTALSWPIIVSQDFLDLLQNRHPLATEILSHYCHLLDYAGSRTWYLKGWGRCVLRDITATP